MFTAILTPPLKLSPPGRRHRRRVPRFRPPPLAPGLPSQNALQLTAAVLDSPPRERRQTALSFLRDVALATLVTLVFLSPFLYFVAPPFTWKWTIGVGLGIVALTVYARRRMRG
ncbi:MAG TPA: hypothetical protein VMM36_01765 [Opitutaceae bacterium]|nr:hypothetical protein [Opitutaceae bacterium]